MIKKHHPQEDTQKLLNSFLFITQNQMILFQDIYLMEDLEKISAMKF
jgi:hypothetical protein